MSFAVTASIMPCFSAFADEQTEPEKYPYTMFAASNSDGAITINAGNFCVNGNVATNGTIVSSGNMNVNGTKTEYAEESMIYIFDKIDTTYFSNSNFDVYNEDFVLDEMNINIDTPTEVEGETILTGNININTSFKALENINLNGEVKNTNNSLIFSEYGDIIIDSQNVNLNGLVYAPFGDVEITAQNLNLNNVVIIADGITLNCPSVNANSSNNAGVFVGVESEECPIIKIDKKNLIYSADNDFYYATADFNGLCGYLGKFDSFDSFKVEVYDVLDTLIYTDNIDRQFRWRNEQIGLMAGLNKIVLTAFQEDGKEYTCTINLMVDSSKFVDNLQVDLDDNDGDGLWNYIEIYLGTDPDKADTDEDGLNDWVEVYVLGYNPLSADTDDDGIDDGDEDEDEDGLTNAFEINEFNSSPIAADTDHEGLPDNEEYKYGTSPNMKDTDEDGISDYDEIYLFELDPLSADPSDIQLTKTFTVDDITGDYDEAVYPTLTLRGDVDCIKNFAMNKLGRTTVINPSSVGYLGAAYDFRTSGRMDGATLTFTYDPELIMEIDQSEENFTPAIYYFNEETCDIEEVPNQTWEGNQVTAELEHFSIYLLLNKTALEFFWNSALDLPDAPDDIPVQIDRQIAFLLDRSGSMNWNDEQNIRGQLTKEFCNLLEPADSVSIYGFNSDIDNYNNRQFISDSDSINSSIDKFIAAGNNGGTYIANALTSTYNDLIKAKKEYENDNEDSKSVLCQYVFLLTDGQSSDTPSDDLLKNFRDEGIKIFTVGFGSADHMYLKRISDSTYGKPYSADSTSDLNDIFLKFNDEIEVTDANKDGISDYYEYLMCEGIITTRLGTRVFEGYTYEEIMENDDLDNDDLNNGEEVAVFDVNFKPFAFISSDPTLQYTDRDSYDDYVEAKNGTSSHTVDYLIEKNDYFELFNGSNYNFTTSANKYLNENEYKLAFNYFIDVVFCGSETYFDTIKQGVQDGYFVVTGQGGTVGSENMLMKQHKGFLVEYLTKITNIPNEQTESEIAIQIVRDIIDNVRNVYGTIDSIMDMSDVKADQRYQKMLEEETSNIAKLMSEYDKGIRAAAKNRKTFTIEEQNKFAEMLEDFSRRQSEISRGIFKEENYPELQKRIEKNTKKIDTNLMLANALCSRGSQVAELIRYGQILATFEQYREFICELSHCDYDYVAVAAGELLEDLDSVEKSKYLGRGTYEFVMGTLSDAMDIGLEKAIEKCCGTAGAIFSIAQFVLGGVIGENLSYERQNLISADLSSQITLHSAEKIQSVCGGTKLLGDGERYYVASGAKNCVIANQYMIYYIITRQFGEEKYAELGRDESGLLGKLNYNTIKDKYGIMSILNAESNVNKLQEMLEKYIEVFKES